MAKIKKKLTSEKSSNNNVEQKLQHKIRLRKKIRKLRFISPLSFNKTNHFYFQITKILKIIESRNSFEKLKLNNDDIYILKREAEIIENKIKKDPKIIFVDKNMADLITNFKPITIKINNEEAKIKEIIEKSKDRISLSCRKISQILREEYNMIVCKSKIHLILKNRLKLSYRKTAIKNLKIISPIYLKMANIFLKIIIRAIKLNYTLIFLDESKIQQVNSNLHCWRGNNDYIFNNSNSRKKTNLLLAVSPNGFIHYKINDKNTNTHNFKIFFEELIGKIGEEQKKNSIFIMDNLSCHVSVKMKKFYQSQKINVITNVPYLSPFNLIELSFKKIKQKLYRKAYGNIKDAIKDTETILNSESFKNSLLNQYLETLVEYENFILKYLKKE